MLGGVNLTSVGVWLGVALIANQAVKTVTDWTVRQGIGWVWNFVRAEGTSRDDLEGNQQALEIVKQLRSKLERKEEELSDYEWMIRSLKSENISKKRIIEQYWRPLPAIIITFFNDYEEDESDTKFLKKHILDNNSAEMLTGNTYAIPPKGFPERFDSPSEVGRDDIRDWVEEDILGQQEGGKAVICQASVVDLRRVYSHTDYESHSFNRKTIDEALDISKILDNNDVHRILATDNVNLSKAIENGDIAFFISRYVSEEELSIIHENQDEIRQRLGNPSLRRMATTDFKEELEDVIGDYLDAPDTVSEKAVEDAKLWYSELQS